MDMAFYTVLFQSVDVLLKSGADPNIPLGQGVGNAMCALTTHTAHRWRVILSTTSNATALLHRLAMEEGNIFSKVKLTKGGVGTILDFAHAAFCEV